MKSNDVVNHPSHYTSHPSGVECIDITRHMNFNLGNVIKYLWRAGLKDNNPTIQDLQKAKFYLENEIDRISPNKEKDIFSANKSSEFVAIIEEYISKICNIACGCFIYNDLEFRIQEFKNVYSSYNKIITQELIDSITVEDAKQLLKYGFSYWDNDTHTGDALLLFPLYTFDLLSDDITLIDIFGNIENVIDNDNRFGCLPYGIVLNFKGKQPSTEFLKTGKPMVK